MASRPLVTVVVPLYNGARYIEATLESVARQTADDVEVVVVDDGSTDDGPDLVRAHGSRVRFLAQEHLGVAVARNSGLAEAQGEWVAFLDQDDLWHPTRLERLLAWCDEHPDEPVVATTELVFDTTDERDELMTDHPLIAEWTSHHVAPARALDELVAAADTTGSDEVEVADLARMLRGPISATTSFLARPRTLQLAGGCAPHAPALDDYWMLVNVARMRPFPKIDQPTTFYRVHLGATSRTTRLALPFLSSAVALRLGGGLLPISDGLHTDTAGELHEHLLDELLRSAQADDHTVRRAARHLAALLWADGHRGALVRAEARRRLPDPAVDAIRRVRGRRL